MEIIMAKIRTGSTIRSLPAKQIYALPAFLIIYVWVSC